VLGAALLTSAALAEPAFTMIPALAGGGNSAAFIAGYGQYIVGDSDSGSTAGPALDDGFRFDRLSLAATSMGALSPSAFSTHAAGICADGAISVGYSLQSITVGATTADRPRAFMWYGFGSPFTLGVAGAAVGDLGASYALAISGDGGAVVGSTTTASGGDLRAFKWNAGLGFTVLPALTGTGPSSARACSFNGFVIVGDSAGQAFRWTNTGGAGTTSPIPSLPQAPNAGGTAFATNTIGNIVVGSTTSPTFVDTSLGFPMPQPVAFRWTPAGTRALGAFASTGSQSSQALSVSGNGQIVVGDSRTSGTLAEPGRSEAFVWTPRWGMASLADKLGDALPAGVLLTSATGISYDGTTICGTGSVTSTGTSFAYIATIAYCPADQNGSGVLEVDDIFQFINDWMGSLSVADADGNGVLEVQDIFEFLNNWFAGC
jgi:uncharacterized membrane protein